MEYYPLIIILALLSTIVKYYLKFGKVAHPKKIKSYLLGVFPLFIVLISGIYIVSESIYLEFYIMIISDDLMWKSVIEDAIVIPCLISLSTLFLCYNIAIKSSGFSKKIGLDIAFLFTLLLLVYPTFIVILLFCREAAYGLVYGNFDPVILIFIVFILGLSLFMVFIATALILQNLRGSKQVNAENKFRDYEEIKR